MAVHAGIEKGGRKYFQGTEEDADEPNIKACDCEDGMKGRCMRGGGVEVGLLGCQKDEYLGSLWMMWGNLMRV